MSEEKYFFDAAMNKDKSNTDKVIEILESAGGVTDITIFYDVDFRPPRHQRILRALLLAGLLAGLASWLARRRAGYNV